MLEKLLTLLTALIAAVEANTAAQKAAPAKVKGKADTTTSDAGTSAPTQPTVEDVRNAAAEYLAAAKTKEVQQAFVVPLNAKYGSKRITEAPAEKFAEIIAAFKAETAKLTKAKEEPADSGI